MANLDEVRAEVEVVTKQYSKPAIIHELNLETRAGSTIIGRPGNPADPLGIDPNQQ